MSTAGGWFAGLIGLVTHYGYLGVALTVFVEGFGVPAPGETAIIAVSGAAGTGRLNILVVALIAFLAAVSGDSIGYLIGRVGGRPALQRVARLLRLKPDRLASLERFMDRHGPKVVAGARFVEGLRQLNGLVAGATGMRWPRFVLANAIGAALWVSVWCAVGYLAGNHWTTILATADRYRLVAIACAVVAAAGLLGVRLLRRRRHAC